MCFDAVEHKIVTPKVDEKNCEYHKNDRAFKVRT